MLSASLAWSNTTLEEVTVTAQRNLLGQSLDAGNTVLTVTDRNQVSLNRTVGDWIERLPGVSLNGQGGLYQSYSLRGFSRWRVRTEVDGVPIITDRRAGNSASFLPPELLQQTDVSLGPASSLYGSGAMGGVVSLETPRQVRSHLTMSGQSNDNGFATTAGFGYDQLGAIASYRQADNATDAHGNTLNTGYQQFGAAFKGNAERDGLRFTGTWIPSYGEDIGKSNAESPDTSVSEYPEELHSVLKFQVEREGQWLGQLYHHFQDWQSRTERVGVRTNLTDYRGHTVGGLFYSQTQFLSGNGRYGVEWLGRRGVSIHDREYSSEDELVAVSHTIDGDADSLGAFVDQHWLLGPLSVGGGLRYDHIQQSDRDREREDGHVTGNATLSWHANEAWQLSAEVGSAFRFPSLTELYFNGVTPRGDTLGNPKLKPEQSEGLQLAARFRQGDFGVSLSTYYNSLENYIERYSISPTLRSYRNIEDAAIWGYEASLDWGSEGPWQHVISYQWQQGEDSDGNWLADLNPPALRYLLTWEHSRVRVSSDLLYRLSRDEIGAGEQPLEKALVWNASGRYALTSGIDLELYVTNLLDEYYLGTADEDAAYQPGRTVGLRFRWRDS